MRGRRIIPIALLVLLGAGAIGVWIWRTGGPEIVTPPDGASIDPEVLAILDDAIASVHASPRNAEMRLQLAMVYKGNNLPESARVCYRQVLEMDPDQPKAWYGLALANEETGLIDEAIAAMEQAISVDPTYPAAHWRLGLWLIDRGAIEQAEAELRQGNVLDARHPAPWFGLTRVYLARGEFVKAADLIMDRGLLRGEYRGYASHLLALAYRGAGNAERASAAVRAAAPGKPQWRDAWADEPSGFARGIAADRQRAEGHIIAGRFNQAIPLLERVRRAQADNFQIANLLGISYIQAGRRDEGLATLREAIDLAPQSAKSHINLARALLVARSSSLSDFATALHHVNTAIDLNPHSAEPYVLKGRILRARGDSTAAIEMFKAGFRADSRTVLPLIDAGFTQLTMQLLADARATFHQAVQWDPLSAEAKVGLALMLIADGDADGAEELIDQAIEFGVSDRYRDHLEDARENLLELRAQNSVSDD